MSSAKFSDVDFVGGEEGGDLMPSELAKRFQSQVVKHLNQVQVKSAKTWLFDPEWLSCVLSLHATNAPSSSLLCARVCSGWL